MFMNRIVTILSPLLINCALLLSAQNSFELDNQGLVHSIDKTSAAAPCEDFYQFVCKGFDEKQRSMLGDGTEVLSQWSLLWDLSKSKLRTIMNDESQKERRHRSANCVPQMYLFYEKCRDREQQRKEGVAGLKRWLSSHGIEGRERHLDSDWIKKAFPNIPFYDIRYTFDINAGRPKQNVMLWIKPKYPLLLDHFERNPIDDTKIRGALLRIAKALKADGITNYMYNKDGDVDEAEKRVEALLKIERILKKLLDEISKTHPNWFGYKWYLQTERAKLEAIVVETTVGHFQSNYGIAGVDWVDVLRELTGDSHIHAKTPLLLSGGREFFDAIKLMLEKPSGTSNGSAEEFGHFLDWHLLMPLLYEADGNYFNDVPEPFSGKSEQFCVGNYLRYFFPHCLDMLYVEEELRGNGIGEKIKAVQTMLPYIQDAFREMIGKNNWLDQHTREYIGKKMEAMPAHIAYHQMARNVDQINRIYAKFNLRPGMTWVEMFASVRRQTYLNPHFRQQYRDVPLNANKWSIDENWTSPSDYANYASDVDGWYSEPYNSWNIFGGVMNSPWFDVVTNTDAMNFGALGTLMAHELTHAFDAYGVMYDENGNWNPWMTERIKNVYKQKTQCVQRQYEQYPTEIGRKKDLTLTENIADTDAIKIAHMAWRKYTADHPKAIKKVIKGMEEYNDEQLFFMANAFTHCRVMTRKQMEWFRKNDDHAFSSARVNLPLKNYPTFGHAWKCPIGSALNPADEKEQCCIWFEENEKSVHRKSKHEQNAFPLKKGEESVNV